MKQRLFYGWIIVLLAFFSITTYGLFYSYSGFIESLETDLHTTRAALSGVYTLYMAVYCLCGTPMGSLCDKFGPRKTLMLSAVLIGSGAALCSLVTSIWQLYLFFGLIAGTGHGAIWVVSTSTISRWFVQKRGLAVGVAACGIGAGLLIMPPLSVQIIGAHDWRPAFIVLGAVFFTINMIVALFIKGSPGEMGSKPYTEAGGKVSAPGHISSSNRDYSLVESFKTRAFWLIYLLSLFCFSADQMALVHIIPYSGAIGIPASKAALGLSSLGVGTIIGRLSAGVISDRIGRISTMVACCCFETIGIFGLLAVNSVLTLYLTMFFIGVGYGGSVVLSSVLMGDFFGLKNLGVISGIWLTHGALAGPLGPLLGGIIFVSTDSYFLAILIGGILCFVAIILATLIRSPHKTQHPEAMKTT